MPESVSCGLCGSLDAIPQVTKTRVTQLPAAYQVQQCRPCGFTYLSPRPTRDELIEIYAADPFWSLERTRERPRRRSFDARRFAGLERLTGGPGKLLVMACLEGGYLMQNARARGWQTIGVEFVEPLLEHAEGDLGLDMIRSPLWDLSPFVGRRFDAIYTHSLEHIPDVGDTLRSFAELLAPGGVLMIEAPNQFEALKERVKQGLWIVVGDRLTPLLYGEVTPQVHLSFFTPRTLRRALEGSGFDVLGTRTYAPWNPTYHGTRRWRTLRELSFLVGGVLGRGPATEVIARPTR